MEGAETNLGDAAISFNSDSYQLTGAGFFAQAYTWNGKTIISYRGTDFIPTDAITGWPTGLDNER